MQEERAQRQEGGQSKRASMSFWLISPPLASGGASMPTAGTVATAATVFGGFDWAVGRARGGLGAAAAGFSGAAPEATALTSARRASTSAWLTPSEDGPLRRCESGRSSPGSRLPAVSEAAPSIPQTSIIELTRFSM